MAQVWQDQISDHPETADVIQAGLDKLDVYIDRTDMVPAYILAMGV